VQKTAEPIEMQFGTLSRVGPGKHVLDGMHNGATCRIRLSGPCVAAMRTYVKLLWPLVFSSELTGRDWAL